MKTEKEGKAVTANSGALYLCATPIGNLGDMTYRAVETLKQASLIAAEDTRHTRKLLSHFDIHVPLTSYHEHNKRSKGPELIAMLQEGRDIALVSDAGLPGISDPGEDLVQLALAAGITVTPIPGASAALTALVASGLPTAQFMFAGFLPNSVAERRSRIAALRDVRDTLIFYEAPHRLLRTLADLQAGLGERRAVAARELTKLHEEFVRGTLTELMAHFADARPRGEFTVLVAGRSPDEQAKQVANDEDAFSDENLIQAVEQLIAAGENKKDAIKKTASRLGLSRRRVYRLMIESD